MGHTVPSNLLYEMEKDFLDIIIVEQAEGMLVKLHI